MQVQIFTVFDAAANHYNAPFFQHTEAMAQRTFSQWINDPEGTWRLSPNDYTLYHLGSIDLDTSMIDAHPPRAIGSGSEFFQQTEE